MNNSRALIIIIFFSFFFLGLTARLFQIQIANHEDFDYDARRQQTEKRVLRAERGFILDRNGELLAFDRQCVSFYADLRMLKKKNREALADTFASVFNKSKSYYLRLMNSSKRIVCLEKKAPMEQAFKLKDYVVDGFFTKEDPTRVYSYDNLASHVLGYVAGDYEGVEGIEKFYNKELTGINGQMVVERDVKGRMVTVAEDATVPPIPGCNIELTIDRNYQKILEEEILKGITQYMGKSATGIIINPENGEILAMANAPDFNPNNYWQFGDFERRNRALTDTYEPGSTFKSLTLSVMLNEDKCRGGEMIYAENGTYKFRKVNIRDSHKSQWLSVREVLEQSSNIGMAKLSTRIEDEDFYKYLRNYGFGNYTFVDLPGESRGRLKKPASFNDLTKAFMSYGYEVSVTPVQLAAAYAALVNGGNLYQPHLLKRITTRQGETRFSFEPKMLRTVISRETSDKIKDYMVGVVENGTATGAKIEGMKIGGKTGTSQMLINNRYSSSSYNSSFAGFFPVDKPKIVCLILVNSPQVGRYGGMVAAPIFKNIAQRLVAVDKNLMEGTGIERENFIEQVFAGAEKKQAKVSYANVAEKKSEERTKVMNKRIMPDLKNQQLRDALSVLSDIGLKYKVQGNGKVISQSIMPGSSIKPGLVVMLKCEQRKLSGVRIY